MEAYLRACSLISAQVVPVPVGDRDNQVRYGVTLRCPSRSARVMYSIRVRIPKRELPLVLLLVFMVTVTALTANLKATWQAPSLSPSRHQALAL